MHVRLQPARIVQRSGFNRHRTEAPLGFVVDPRTALRAKGAELGSTASGFRCEGFHFALGEPKVRFVDEQGHAKGAAGLALAIGAMAGNELLWWPHHFIANLAALTASCIFGRHNFDPPRVWVPLGHKFLFIARVTLDRNRPKAAKAGIQTSHLIPKSTPLLKFLGIDATIHRTASRTAFASFKSAVSKPSVNQP